MWSVSDTKLLLKLAMDALGLRGPYDDDVDVAAEQELAWSSVHGMYAH